jgi:membrane fusion protein (multidrug efflux system)
VRAEFALLLTLLLAACKGAGVASTGATPSPPEQVRATPVKTAPAVRGTLIRTLHLTGVGRAWQSANLAPAAQGTVEAVHVGIGMDVRAGQLLAEIDTTTLALQADQARKTVELARLQAEDAERERSRAEGLLGSGAVADATVDKARFAERLGDAQLAQAEAAVRVVEAQLAHARLTAPFDGTVTAVAVDPGEFWTPAASLTGPPTLVVIDNLALIRLDVHLNDVDLVLVHPELPALITTPALPGLSFPGSVALVNASADGGARTFTAVLSVPNPERKLKPGMFLEAAIAVEQRLDVVSVPEPALGEAKDGTFVMLLDGDRARRALVTLGLRGDGGVEVQGVNEGASVLVDGHFGLPDGSLVRVVD